MSRGSKLSTRSPAASVQTRRPLRIVASNADGRMIGLPEAVITVTMSEYRQMFAGEYQGNQAFPFAPFLSLSALAFLLAG